MSPFARVARKFHWLFLGVSLGAPAQACINAQPDINGLMAGQVYANPLEDRCILGTATLRAGALISVSSFESPGNYFAGLFTIGDPDVDPRVAQPDKLVVNGLMSVSGFVGNYGEVVNSSADPFNLQLSPSAVWVNGAGSMTNDSGIISRGTFQAGADFRNNGAFYSYGALSNSQRSDSLADVFTNRGSLIVRGSLDIGGKLENHGQLFLEGNQHYFFIRSPNGPGDTVVVSTHAGSDIRIGSNAVVTIGGNGTNTGFGGDGLFSNAGTLDIERGGFLALNSYRNETGATLEIARGGAFQAHTFENANGAVVVTKGSMDFVGGRNDGTFVVADSGSVVSGQGMAGTGTLRVTDQATFRFIGDITQDSIVVTDGGRFCGSGSVTKGGVGAQGILCPGNSPGVMTFAGDLDFHGGILEIEIAGVAAGLYDVLKVNGLATFAGGLVKLIFLDGYVPGIGDSWQFLVLNGGFSGLDTLAFETFGLPDDRSLAFSFGANGITATAGTLSAVPEPQTWALFVAGLGLLALRRRPRVRG